MSDNLWKDFWESYNNIEAEGEDDLYIQVGKTKDQKPISNTVFNDIVDDIVQSLNLEKKDKLLELCCGNGLFTLPLSEKVKFVFAFDFTKKLIDAAKKFKSKNNIEYQVGDAKKDFLSLFSEDVSGVKKFLINDATAYFNPLELDLLLEKIKIISGGKFTLYLTNIPNDEKKWDFYNTPERKEKYLKYIESDDQFLGGLGRWWTKDEFRAIAEKYDLNLEIKNLENDYSYRMNVLITKQ